LADGLEASANVLLDLQANVRVLQSIVVQGRDFAVSEGRPEDRVVNAGIKCAAWICAVVHVSIADIDCAVEGHAHPGYRTVRYGRRSILHAAHAEVSCLRGDRQAT